MSILTCKSEIGDDPSPCGRRACSSCSSPCVARVSSAQARPSAEPSAATGRSRSSADSIEQIHPAPFRSISRARFEAEVNELAARAPTISRDELLVGVLRIIASLGPRNGHTGLFPGDPGNVRPLHLYPIRLYRFADGVFVVDAKDKGLVGRRLVAVDGMPGRAACSSSSNPLVASRQRVEHAWHGSALRADRGGPARASGSSTRRGRPTSRSRCPERARTDVTLTPILGPQYAGEFADPLHGHYPSVLPSAPRPLYLANSGKALWVTTLAGGRAVYVGFNAVSRPGARGVPPDPSSRARGAYPSRDRRRPPERRGRQHDVRPARRPLRVEAGEPAGQALPAGRACHLLGGGQLRRRDGSRHPGRHRRRAHGRRRRDIRRHRAGVCCRVSGWYVYVASRYHERKRGPSDHRLAVAPDVRVGLTSAQYFAGQDPVLERALSGL